MTQPTMEEMIGGTVQEKDPLGKALADSIEQGAGEAVQGVVNWYQRASADQAGYGDDLLRLIAGGVRNTTNAWKAGTADQEGIHDDFLRGVGWVAHQGFRAADAASYYGGKAGGNIARMVGVDPRLGGFAGNLAGEALLGFGAKAAYKGAVRTIDKVSDATMALAYGIGGTGGASATLGSGLPDVISGLSKNVDNYLGNTIKHGDLDWVRPGGGLDKALTDFMTIKRGPNKGKIQTLEELIKSTKVGSKSQRRAAMAKLDQYKSLVATGPAKNADDVIFYGRGKNLAAKTKDLDHPDYVPAFHKSTEFHHKGMKSLQYGIHKRARELRAAGKATDGDLLNLHKLGEHMGIESGSRKGAGIFMHRTPHQVLHQDLMLKTGIQPSAQKWLNNPLRSKPPDVQSAVWNAAKKVDSKLTRYDVEYIQGWLDLGGKQGPMDLNRAISEWKRWKNSPAYKLYGPDGLSEIDRILKRMDTMSIDELTQYQKEIFETISKPMTEEALLLEEMVSNLSPTETIELTVEKTLTNRDRLKSRKRILKEHREQTAALDLENRAWEAYNRQSKTR